MSLFTMWNVNNGVEGKLNRLHRLGTPGMEDAFAVLSAILIMSVCTRFCRAFMRENRGYNSVDRYDSEQPNHSDTDDLL